VKRFGPLVDVAWVATHGADPGVRLVDCRWWLEEPRRARREYAGGHLPGAILLSLDDDLSAREGPGRHPLPHPRTFAARMEAAGVCPETTVVAYDDRGGGFAARLWWMLTALGAPRVAVLDGGIQAWLRAGRPLERPTPPTRSCRFGPVPASWPGTVDRREVASLLGRRPLVDVRTPERFRGETEPIDPVAGHIPTAVNLPYTGSLDADLRFLSATALRARFAALGIDDADFVVACGSGVTACHGILAAELAGLGRPLLYPGSWSDWCTSGGPIARGERPGEVPSTA